MLTISDEVLGDMQDDADGQGAGQVGGVDQPQQAAHHADQGQGRLVDRTARRTGWTANQREGTGHMTYNTPIRDRGRVT